MGQSVNQVTSPGRAPMPLHWKMRSASSPASLLGLVVHYGVGADAGWVQALTTYVTQPFATMFLRLIFMLVIPLLFSALVVGVAEMGDIRALGRIGWKTLAYTVVRVRRSRWCIGLVLVNLFKPGAGVDPALAQQLLSARRRARAGDRQRQRATQPTGLDMLLSIVPDNVVARRRRATTHPGGDVLRADVRHRPGADAQRRPPTRSSAASRACSRCR